MPPARCLGDCCKTRACTSYGSGEDTEEDPAFGKESRDDDLPVGRRNKCCFRAGDDSCFLEGELLRMEKANLVVRAANSSQIELDANRLKVVVVDMLLRAEAKRPIGSRK